MFLCRHLCLSIQHGYLIQTRPRGDEDFSEGLWLGQLFHMTRETIATGSKHLLWQHNCLHCSRLLNFRKVWGVLCLMSLKKFSQLVLTFYCVNKGPAGPIVDIVAAEMMFWGYIIKGFLSGGSSSYPWVCITGWMKHYKLLLQHDGVRSFQYGCEGGRSFGIKSSAPKRFITRQVDADKWER